MGCQEEAWKTDFDSWVTSNMPASITLYKQWERVHCREICLTSEQLWGKCMGTTQWCQTRDRPAHSRLWGRNRMREEGKGKKRKRGAGKRGCWWRRFSKEKLVTTALRAMNGRGGVENGFPKFVKLIKMAAAVAKAQEKNRVPERPQVLWLFLAQGHREETGPTEPS